MKEKALVLVLVVVLLFTMSSAIMAQDNPLCPPFHGLEVHFQIGANSPSFAGVDLGIISQGYFNLGIGGSISNINTKNFLGGYLKLGILTFDMLKAKCLVNPATNEWYGSFKTKFPFGLVPFGESIVFPFSAGFQYTESYFKNGCNSAHLQEFSTLFGIDVPIYRQAEVWIELQFPKQHTIYRSCSKQWVKNIDTMQFEMGFAFCF